MMTSIFFGSPKQRKVNFKDLLEQEGMKETSYFTDKSFLSYNKYQIQSTDIYSCWKFALIAGHFQQL